MKELTNSLQEKEAGKRKTAECPVPREDFLVEVEHLLVPVPTPRTRGPARTGRLAGALNVSALPVGKARSTILSALFLPKQIFLPNCCPENRAHRAPEVVRGEGNTKPLAQQCLPGIPLPPKSL